METLQLKKNDIKNLIKALLTLEKKYSYFNEKSLLDFCDLDIKEKGFSIVFSRSLPDTVIDEIAKIFGRYTDAVD